MRVPHRHRAIGALAVLAFSLGTTARPAQAQFGIIKRAAERRVEQKVDDQANIGMLVQPTFDATTVEITGDRLDKYVAAAVKQKGQVEATRQKVELMKQHVGALRDSADKADNQKERAAYGAARDRWDQCRDDVRSAMEVAQEKKAREMTMAMQANPTAAMNDPKMKQMMAIMQEAAAAQQRNDAAALQAAQMKLAVLMGSSSDSVSVERAAVAKCGARTAMPASMVRSDELRNRADALDKDANQLQFSPSNVPGSALGVTDAQARMFDERIRSWLTGMRNDAPITKTFSRAEYDLLVSRRGDLRKALFGRA